MIKRVKNILFVVIVIHANFLICQAQDDKYEEFIMGNKIYKPGCGWFKIGFGKSYNFKLNTIETNSNLCYSFRIKKYSFQLGYHVSSDQFITARTLQRLNDLYFSTGLRKESEKSNISIFTGPSYAYGAHYLHTDSMGEKYYRGFTRIGWIINIEYTRKIFYDLGLGLSMFASINNRYQVSGLMLHLYLSNAYRGQIE
jgi:hypothetical protein